MNCQALWWVEHSLCQFTKHQVASLLPRLPEAHPSSLSLHVHLADFLCVFPLLLPSRTELLLYVCLVILTQGEALISSRCYCCQRQDFHILPPKNSLVTLMWSIHPIKFRDKNSGSCMEHDYPWLECINDWNVWCPFFFSRKLMNLLILASNPCRGIWQGTFVIFWFSETVLLVQGKGKLSSKASIF